MQIPLIKLEPIAPLPVDSGHYVAAVQNKKGELDALRHASDETWKRMTPLVHFVGPKGRTDPLNVGTVRAWVSRVAAAVGSHPVYLDVLRPGPTFIVETTDGTAPLLQVIYAAARKRGLRFVPVARAGGPRRHLDLVAEAAACDGHGAALRCAIRDIALPEGTTARAYLEGLLTSLGVDVEDADFLVDLGYIDSDVELDIAPTLQELEDIGSWRSVVVLGTSIPSMMGCIAEGTVGSLARREWELWRSLSEAGLSRLPAFGDYGVQHPRPPEEGGGPGMRANIRYTAKDATLVARGQGAVIQEGAEQYRLLCEQLVARSEFAGADYSWGDAVISDCADSVQEPGSQSLWRGVGTSHHIQVVTDQLRQWQAGS